MIYPRPIRSIHQIEITTHCNLRCRYCPHPVQEVLRQQKAMDMEWRIFDRALDWVCELNDRRDDRLAELSLTGIGEALLHPDFVDYVAHARKRLGPAIPLVFSTNGILLDDEMCKSLAPYRPRINVSLHRMEKAGPAIQVAKKYGLYDMVNPAPAIAAFNWAGAIDWFVSAPPLMCDYLRYGWGVVLVDGRITTCCLDTAAKGVVGHVDDDFTTLTAPGTGLKPWGDATIGCAACHMTPP
jgi:MoaA/NifB/PqqE/SkfB family radical SAM enzyme